MKRAMIVLTPFILTVVASFPAMGDVEKIKLADCPAAVQKTLIEEAKGAVIEAVTRDDDDGEATYAAVVVIGGKKYEISVTGDGTLDEIALQVDDDEIALSDCPAAVRKTLGEESKGAKVEGVRMEMKFGVKVYRVIVALGGKDYEIKVAEDGTLTEKSLVIEEAEIGLDDCPAAVQETFRREARGGDLGDITRMSGLGRGAYQSEVVIMGKKYNLEVAEDGMLISKSLDEDE